MSYYPNDYFSPPLVNSSSIILTSSTPNSYYRGDEDQDDKQKRFFTDDAIDVLNRWFEDNQDYPYPDETTTRDLARTANISTKQVRKWFANKRVRSNKCMKQSYKKKRSGRENKENFDQDDSLPLVKSVQPVINESSIQQDKPQIMPSPNDLRTLYYLVLQNMARSSHNRASDSISSDHLSLNSLSTSDQSSEHNCSTSSASFENTSNSTCNSSTTSSSSSTSSSSQRPRVNFGVIADLIS